MQDKLAVLLMLLLLFFNDDVAVVVVFQAEVPSFRSYCLFFVVVVSSLHQAVVNAGLN